MRVLHFIHWPRSGITTLVKDLIDASSGDVKYGVVFIVPNYDECKEMEGSGIAVYDISGVGIVGQYRKLRKLYGDFKPDVVHLHSFLPSLLWLLAVGKKTNTIRTVHSVYPYFYDVSIRSKAKRAAEAFVLRRLASINVAVSNEIIPQLPPVLSGLDFRAILNGVKIPNVADYKSHDGQLRNKLNFLSVGRLEDEKGYDLLIEAVSILALSGLVVNVTIVGEGSKRSALEARAANLNIQDKIHFTGYLTGSFKMLDISSFSGFVSSSRFEGLCIAALEAMAYRLPLITTESGGLSDLLTDGWDAVIVPYGAQQIADGIRRFSHINIKEQTEIGKRGCERVMRDFSIQRTLASYEELYQIRCL